MSNLINAEAISIAYGTRTLLDGVSLGLDDGDPIGVVGRNGAGKSTLLRSSSGCRARLGPGHPPGARAGRLPAPADDLAPAATVRDVVVGGRPDHEWAGDAAIRTVVALLPGVGLDAGRPLSRRRAPPGRAGRAAGPRHDLLVLDEPTNHLDVARSPGWPRTWSTAARRVACWSSPTTGGSSTRSAPALGGADDDRRRVRGRLRGLGPGPGRARPAGGRDRGAAAEPAAQGDRLAAPRPAGPHVEAEVPHRRRQRADRRRAAAARHGSAAALGHRPAGQGRLRPRGRRRSAAGDRMLLTTSPGRRARATGSAWSA